MNDFCGNVIPHGTMTVLTRKEKLFSKSISSFGHGRPKPRNSGSNRTCSDIQSYWFPSTPPNALCYAGTEYDVMKIHGCLIVPIMCADFGSTFGR
jgi:hypothetical protein